MEELWNALPSLRLLLDTKREGDDGGDVSVRAIHLDFDSERLAKEAHGLETLLVVGTTTTNVDLDLVSDERSLVLLERTDDTLEGCRDVREVGNTTTNDQALPSSL